ncbi:MAG: phenylalanine--tRNA ligase subunit beta [Lachnospiraceae bacterium]|nr:phenylalanine--tRNA ligase subunit beta [Lachnospiraceae bacterium]
MNASYSWLKAYVPDLSCSDQELFDALTLTGTKGETWHRLDKNLEKIVVGQVKEIKQHPDADKLVICQVDIGTETIQIVTGAQNLFEGAVVPVVLSGGKVAGGHDGGPLPENGIPIKAGKLRGIESNGMMCSIEELGCDKDLYPESNPEGIHIFSEQDGLPAIGSDGVEALGLRDTLFEFEITSNRVDCYSILGIAREAAATFKLPFVKPKPQLHETDERAEDYISVRVEDKDLCTCYCARVCTDIKIGPSPKWMRDRLRSCGIRPINNLVDITNYVMLEYGQPMHAFDLDTVAGHQIIVRRAKDGDRFVTLDGEERTLDHDVLMICDAEKEIGIAGIMGGENSMITDQVKTVLFEAATFNGPNIRKSAKRIGLRTDASGLFEKGLDRYNAEQAINRACALVEELGCGRVTRGIVQEIADRTDNWEDLPDIPFNPDEINALLGTTISREEMIDILKREEIIVNDFGEVIAPSFRQDLNEMCDITEEIARFYGYDKIPVTLPKNSATTGGLSWRFRVEETLRERACYAGFSQAFCYSFESPRVFDMLRLPADAKEREAIRIANPLGEDFSIMRTIPLNGILTSLSTNFNRRNKDVHLFEMGNIYLAKSLPLTTESPYEQMQLTLGFYSQSGDEDFYTMKGVVEALLASVSLLKCSEIAPFPEEEKKPFLHPGRQAVVKFTDWKDHRAIGYLGELHPAVAETYGIRARTYVAVLDCDDLQYRASFNHHYEGIAKFPAVTRDISMLVPKEVPAGDIEKMIRQRGGKTLESLQLFDLYEGEQISEGFKSMAYSLVFRNKEKTLSDEEVQGTMKKILNGLSGMKIELRS